MKCWICGNEAKTGEHLIKASDIRRYFGTITQDKPLYYHANDKKNKALQSANSKFIKSSALICKECNNTRTQRHDRAWEVFSKYLQSNPEVMRKGTPFKLSKVFPGETNEALLSIHLYFVKLFGCRIVEHDVPIDIGPFSYAVISNTPHKDVYIGIGYWEDHLVKKTAGLTEIHTANSHDKADFAAWFYIIGKIGINIIYSPYEGVPNVASHLWHPSEAGKFFKFSDFKT